MVSIEAGTATQKARLSLQREKSTTIASRRKGGSVKKFVRHHFLQIVVAVLFCIGTIPLVFFNYHVAKQRNYHTPQLHQNAKIQPKYERQLAQQQKQYQQQQPQHKHHGNSIRHVSATVASADAAAVAVKGAAAADGGFAAYQPDSVEDYFRQFAPYFANNGYAKAFDTMQYPMGFYDETTHITYVAYQGPHEDPFICTYNHTSLQWDGPYRAGVSILGHETDPQQMHDGRIMSTSGAEHKHKFLADNHGKPAIIMDDRGYIHMSFGAHGGDISLKETLGENKWGDYSGGRQLHVRSSRPHDISSWDKLNNSRLDWNGCYAQMIKSPNGTLYHFVRHGSHVSCWAYQRSTDYGETWHDSIPIVLTKNRTDMLLVKDSWYCRFRHGVGSKDHIIMATCIYHRHNKPPNHNLEAFNIYYMELDTRTEEWYNVKGEEITQYLPLAKERADEVVQVLETEHNPRFPYHYLHPGSVAMDDEGRPHILAKIATSGEPTGGNVGRGHRQMFYIKWTGTEWTEPVAVTGENKPHDSSDIEVDEDGDFSVDPATGRVLVFFSMTNAKGLSRVTQWESTDRGATFHLLEDLFQSDSFGHFRVSAMFHNGHPDAIIAAYSITNKEPYHKLFVFGNSGPLLRPRADADVCKAALKTIHYNSRASTCLTEIDPEQLIDPISKMYYFAPKRLLLPSRKKKTIK